MKQKVLFASTNRGKFLELKAPLAAHGIDLVLPLDLGLPTAPPQVDEDRPTYEGNARKKAQAYALWSGMPTLADDTGLEVECLGGAPGIYSARYAGPGAGSKENKLKLLKVLAKEKKNRRARFVSTLVLHWPNGKSVEANGSLEGAIVTAERGTGGFGYDTLFEVETRGRTLAELKGAGEIVDTHRTRALSGLIAKLR